MVPIATKLINIVQTILNNFFLFICVFFNLYVYLLMISDFNKKGNSDFFNSNFLFKVAGIFILLFIVFMIFEDIKIYKKKQELAAKIDIYKKQIEEIKNSSQSLKDQIVNADSVDYLEKLGYEQFGQARPGETTYMFVKSPDKTEVAPTIKNSWDLGPWFGWLTGPLNWIKNKF